MNKTIYIRDEDIPIWDRAKELAGDKLSPVIMEGLKRFVAEREAAAKGFERIEIKYEDALDHRVPKIKAFYGRWIIPPSKPLVLTSELGDKQWKQSVAQTGKGNWVVYSETHHCDPLDGQPLGEACKFLVFESASEGAADDEVGYAVRLAIEQRGIQVEELDI